MDPLVFPKFTFSRKVLVTLGALERPVSLDMMSLHVLLQKEVYSEGVVTHGARVGRDGHESMHPAGTILMVVVRHIS